MDREETRDRKPGTRAEQMSGRAMRGPENTFGRTRPRAARPPEFREVFMTQEEAEELARRAKVGNELARKVQEAQKAFYEYQGVNDFVRELEECNNGLDLKMGVYATECGTLVLMSQGQGIQVSIYDDLTGAPKHKGNPMSDGQDVPDPPDAGLKPDIGGEA